MRRLNFKRFDVRAGAGVYAESLVERVKEIFRCKSDSNLKKEKKDTSGYLSLRVVSPVMFADRASLVLGP